MKGTNPFQNVHAYGGNLRSSAILQRVLSASVMVDKELISSIGKGILVFAAVAPGDTEKEVESLAAKVLKMRLWDDDAGGRVWCSEPGS
jgi:D-aminoacyl-tRNA deacylase